MEQYKPFIHKKKYTEEKTIGQKYDVFVMKFNIVRCLATIQGIHDCI